MNSRVIGLVLVTMAVVWPGSPASACFSGLIVIPTADVVAPANYTIYLQYNHAFARAADGTQIVNTEFGVVPRLEAGVDFDLSRGADATVLFNAKYQLQPPDEKHTGVAAGICSLGPHAQAAPFVAATRSFGATRGHAGLMQNGRETDWFVGVDHAIGKRLSVFADYTSGDANESSVGASYQLSDQYGLLVGAMFPNASDDDTEFTVQFLINGSFKKPGGGK
jgi:hypothetical protein